MLPVNENKFSERVYVCGSVVFAGSTDAVVLHNKMEDNPRESQAQKVFFFVCKEAAYFGTPLVGA